MMCRTGTFVLAGAAAAAVTAGLFAALVVGRCCGCGALLRGPPRWAVAEGLAVGGRNMPAGARRRRGISSRLWGRLPHPVGNAASTSVPALAAGCGCPRLSSPPRPVCAARHPPGRMRGGRWASTPRRKTWPSSVSAAPPSRSVPRTPSSRCIFPERLVRRGHHGTHVGMVVLGGSPRYDRRPCTGCDRDRRTPPSGCASTSPRGTRWCSAR